MATYKTILVRVKHDDDLLDKVHDAAQRSGLSVNDTVRRLVRHGLIKTGGQLTMPERPRRKRR